MTPRERNDIQYIVGIAAIVVVMLLLYIGVSWWNGVNPD